MTYRYHFAKVLYKHIKEKYLQVYVAILTLTSEVMLSHKYLTETV